MGMFVNILAIVYAVELCAVSFLLGCKYRNEQAVILDPYDVAQMAKNINMDSDWEECYRAALVLKQAGFGMVVYDKDDHRFAGYSEEGCQLVDWRTEETEEMPHEDYGVTAEQFSTALAKAFHLRVQTVTSKERN